MPVCSKCRSQFPNKMFIEGKERTLNSRKYCLTCSPFGAHNTSRLHINQDLEDQRAQRQAQRRKSQSAYCTKRRHEHKRRAVAYKGGCCVECSYNACIWALEFHHLDPMQKEFSIGTKLASSWHRLVPELDKCVLLCANCHREEEDRVAMARAAIPNPDKPIGQLRVEEHRRRKGLRAVNLLGGRCVQCGYDKCVRAMEFHHADRMRKEFQIRNGNTWSWARIVEELEGCVLLCANCHREVESAFAAETGLDPEGAVAAMN